MILKQVRALTIDGQDIREGRRKKLRRQIGWLPQETAMFQSSARDKSCMSADALKKRSLPRRESRGA